MATVLALSVRRYLLDTLNMRNIMTNERASSASRTLMKGELERSGSAIYSHLYFLGMSMTW